MSKETETISKLRKRIKFITRYSLFIQFLMALLFVVPACLLKAGYKISPEIAFGYFNIVSIISVVLIAYFFFVVKLKANE